MNRWSQLWKCIGCCLGGGPLTVSLVSANVVEPMQHIALGTEGKSIQSEKTQPEA